MRIITQTGPLAATGVIWSAKVDDIGYVDIHVSEIGSNVITNESSADGVTWSTLGSTITTKGRFNIDVSAIVYFRARVSTWSAGYVRATFDTGYFDAALAGNGTVTKADVGLGNVDNTSDANKPVSTAQAAAIAVNTSAINSNTTALATKETIGTYTAGINTQTGTAYTLVLGDVGKLVEMNNAAANTVTVPPNSSVAFPVGVRIDLMQYGAGQTAVAAGAGVTIRSSGAKLKLTGQYSGATLIKRASDEWVLVGDIAT